MNKTIGIVGLGLIGASLALALRDKVQGIYGIERDPKVLQIALERGIIDHGSTAPEGVLEKVDLILLALYPRDAIRWALEHQDLFHEGQLLLDVAGLKKEIVETLQEALPIEFVGTHPMAGREVSGLLAAREELFLGTHFIITPTRKNSQEAIDTIRELATLLGVGAIHEMSPDTHDRLVAHTSHLPHLMALALVGAYEEGSEVLIGRSYQDATRVARINETLWAELFLGNAAAVEEQIHKAQSQLERLATLIRQGDQKALEDELVRLRTLKERTNP